MTMAPRELPQSDVKSGSLEVTSNKRISDEYVKKQGSNQKGTLKYKYKLYTFLIVFSFQLLLNYDYGLMPVILHTIQNTYNFNSTELGVIASLPHLGYFFLSPLLSHILTNYSSKTSLIVSISLNIVALGALGLSVNKYMFYLSKFFIGVTQALYFTYYPLWVDTFAPANHRNLWMSIIQGGIIIGITIGYIMTSVFLYVGKYGWRYSIMTQAIGLGITVALFWMVPKQYIEFDPSKDDIVNFDSCTCDRRINQSTTSMETKYVNHETSLDDKSHHRNNFNVKRCHSLEIVIPPVNHPTQQKEVSRVYSNLDSSVTNSVNPKCSKCFLNNVKLYNEITRIKQLSTWSKFMLLCKYKIYMVNCLFTSIIYFEVFGAHNWNTKIAISYYNMNERTTHLLLTIQGFSASVLGIVSGSHIIDQMIYHYPEYPLLPNFTIIIWGLIASLFGVVLLLNQSPMCFVFCVFIIIFFGASMSSKITLSSVEYLPHNLKPTGASFFIGQYNILGFMLGTLAPGIAIDIYNNYKAGMYIIYLSSSVGMIFYFIITYLDWKEFRKVRKKDLDS